MNQKQPRAVPYTLIIVISVTALLILFFCIGSPKEAIKAFLKQSGTQYDKRIALVLVDAEKAADINKGSCRKQLSQLIDKVSEGKPAVIGIEGMLDTASNDAAADQALEASIKKAGNVVLQSEGIFNGTTVEDNFSDGVIMAAGTKEPYKKFGDNSRTGITNSCADNNGNIVGIIAQIDYKGRYINNFCIEMYNRYLQSLGKDKEAALPISEHGTMDIRYVNTNEEFEKINSKEVLNGKFDPAFFKDKLVLIGLNPSADGAKVPVTLKKKSPMLLTELDANILQYIMYYDYSRLALKYIMLSMVIIFVTAVIINIDRPKSRRRVIFGLAVAYIPLQLCINILSSIVGKLFFELSAFLFRL